MTMWSLRTLGSRTAAVKGDRAAAATIAPTAIREKYLLFSLIDYS
jgi:hypothetical protein